MGLLRGSWTEAKRSWSWFTGHFKVHSLNWDMYAYYPMHGWAWLHPGPLAYDAADKIKPNGPVADSSGYQAISRFVAGTMVSKSATWVSAGVLKNGSPQSWAVPGSQSFHKGIFFFFWFYLFIYLFIYLFTYLFIFMAVLGLRFCARAFSSCGKWGPLFIAVHGPLTITASLVVEHRLQTRRLSNCGSRA